MKKMIFTLFLAASVMAQADIFSCSKLLATTTLDATVTDKEVFINAGKAPITNDLEGYKITGYLYTQNHSYRCVYDQEGNSVEWKNLNYSHAGQNSETGNLGIAVFSYPEPSLMEEPHKSDLKAQQQVNCTSVKSSEVNDIFYGQVAKAILGLDTFCAAKKLHSDRKACKAKMLKLKNNLNKECSNISEKINVAIEKSAQPEQAQASGGASKAKQKSSVAK
jgi:hypothetical protein